MSRVRTAVLSVLVAAAVAVPVVGTAVTTTASVRPTTSADVVAVVADEPAVATSAAATDALAEVEAMAAAADGTVAVVVVAADGTTLLASPGAGDVEYTASLVKLLVVQQLLATTDPSAADLELMAAAIQASDDDAMNQLWVAHDGAALVTAAAAEFGLTGTAAPAEAGQWGESTTTAADYATVLATYADHLPAEDAALLTGWLQGTTSTAADGFDQEFGLVGLDLAGTAAKQGWMCCVADTRQLHSAGVLADGRVVVLLGSFPSSTSWAGARAALDAAATAVVTGTQSGS